MSNRLLKIEEVALAVGVSVKTINNWYKFKKENPDGNYVEYLPNFMQEHERAPRYWYQRDIWDLIEFKEHIPKGRKGIMGSVTQKYINKGGTKNGKKKAAN